MKEDQEPATALRRMQAVGSRRCGVLRGAIMTDQNQHTTAKSAAEVVAVFKVPQWGVIDDAGRLVLLPPIGWEDHALADRARWIGGCHDGEVAKAALALAGAERHQAFVKRLRDHLDGFLGDMPINPNGLRKIMEECGV